MKKVVRDGQVAVLYSPGFGAGWYTWNTEYPDLIFDPDIVAAVESGNVKSVRPIARAKYPEASLGEIENLAITWLPEGTVFEITEYDGNESVREIAEPSQFFIA